MTRWTPVTIVFLARDSIMQSAPYAIARPSVCHMGGSVNTKTVEVRIMQLLPQSSPIPLVFVV